MTEARGAVVTEARGAVVTGALDIRDAERAILTRVLRDSLPSHVRAYVFGSRARGGARAYSDLDLALAGDGPLNPDLIGEIAEALSESDLPYRVDIVDLAMVEPPFRARVMREALAYWADGRPVGVGS